MHASNNHFAYQQIWEHMKANNFKARVISYILPPICPDPAQLRMVGALLLTLLSI